MELITDKFFTRTKKLRSVRKSAGFSPFKAETLFWLEVSALRLVLILFPFSLGVIRNLIVQQTFLHQVRPEMMDYGTKCEPVPPGCGHIDHIHSRISFSHSSAPQFQSFCSPSFSHFGVLHSEKVKNFVTSRHDSLHT